MRSILGLFLAFAIVLLACTVNDKDFQIKGLSAHPTMALPLAFGDLSISDLLNKSDSANIKVKPDGLVYLSYDQALLSHDIRNLIDIPNIGNHIFQLLVPPATYPANQNDFTSVTTSQTIDMGISPEKLTEIGFKSGSLSYNMTLSPANPNFSYAVQIVIPEFFSATNNIFSQQVSGSGTLPLAGYTFKNTTANSFSLQVTLIIRKNSSATTIPPGTLLNITISFGGMNFSYIRGFFGDQVANPPAQSVDIQAFNTSLQNGATVSFAQPLISLNVVSDYGVPLTTTFSKLEATKPGATMQVQINPASPVSIVAPTTLGTSATTPVIVTNVSQLLNFTPTQFYYQVSGHINAGLTSGNNFMADTSQMRVKLHIEIPLYGQASHIVLADTASLDLSSIDQTQIDSAALQAIIVNELPLDADIQFILTDAKYHVIDSLLTTSQTQIIKGSSVDSNGELQSPGSVNESIPINGTKLAKIFTAKNLIIRAKLNTSRNSSGAAVDVKFKSQYKIKVNIGLRTTFKLSSTF